MSAYIKLLTGEYPRHEGDIRLEYPEILETQTGNTFPCPPTYALVVPTTAPGVDNRLQYAYEGPPQRTVNGWVMTWLIKIMSPEEIEARTQAELPVPLFLDQSGAVPDVIA